MVDPLVAAVPLSPSVEELVVVLAQSDALIAVLDRGAGSATGEELQELLDATEQRRAGEARTEVVAQALRPQARQATGRAGFPAATSRSAR